MEYVKFKFNVCFVDVFFTVGIGEAKLNDSGSYSIHGHYIALVSEKYSFTKILTIILIGISWEIYC